MGQLLRVRLYSLVPDRGWELRVFLKIQRCWKDAAKQTRLMDQQQTANGDPMTTEAEVIQHPVLFHLPLFSPEEHTTI
jgi:hypothetical protein